MSSGCSRHSILLLLLLQSCGQRRSPPPCRRHCQRGAHAAEITLRLHTRRLLRAARLVRTLATAGAGHSQRGGATKHEAHALVRAVDYVRVRGYGQRAALLRCPDKRVNCNEIFDGGVDLDGCSCGGGKRGIGFQGDLK